MSTHAMSTMYPVLVYFAGISLVSVSAGTCAFAPLYPYGTDRGDTSVTSGDDDYYRIDFDHAIDFYGSEYDWLYVILNGVFSFSNPMTRSETQTDPLPFPVFSPFWADVRMEEDGGVLYRRIVNLTAERDVADFVQRDSAAIGAALIPDLVAIFTWKNVKTYDGNPLHNNTFQVVLASDGNMTVAIYNYGDITWCGTDVYAGVLFDKGDRATRVSYEISTSPEVINITDYSNVGFPGRIVTRVDGDIQLIPLTRHTCSSCVVDRSSGNVVTFDGSTELKMHSADRKYLISKEYGADETSESDECKFMTRATTDSSGQIDWVAFSVGRDLKRNFAFERMAPGQVEVRGRGIKAVINEFPYYEFITQGGQQVAVEVVKTDGGWMIHSATCQYKMEYNPLDEANQINIMLGPYFQNLTLGMCQNDNGDVSDDRMLCVVPPEEAEGDDFADQIDESCSCPRAKKRCNHLIARL